MICTTLVSKKYSGSEQKSWLTLLISSQQKILLPLCLYSEKPPYKWPPTGSALPSRVCHISQPPCMAFSSLDLVSRPGQQYWMFTRPLLSLGHAWRALVPSETSAYPTSGLDSYCATTVPSKVALSAYLKLLKAGMQHVTRVANATKMIRMRRNKEKSCAIVRTRKGLTTGGERMDRS